MIDTDQTWIALQDAIDTVVSFIWVVLFLLMAGVFIVLMAIKRRIV